MRSNPQSKGNFFGVIAIMQQNKHLLFSFEELNQADSAIREIEREFRRLGTPVATTEIPQKTKRTAGITYREVNMTFSDSQIVTFKVKKTGDIFEVKINGKTVPMRNQDDQKKALEEISNYLTKGSAAFQKKLLRQKVTLPRVSTSSKKQEAVQAERITDIRAEIEAYKAKTADLKAKTSGVNADIATAQADIDKANAS